MRDGLPQYLVLLTAVVLSGCGAKFSGPGGFKNPLASNQASAMFPSQNRDSLSNSQQSTWQRFTSPVSDSALVKTVSHTFRRSTDWVAGEFQPKKKTVNDNDPNRLASGPRTATPDMHLGMAQLMERSGRSEQAIEQYEKALKEDPRHLNSLLGYARVLDRIGRMDDAIEQYQLACRHHPKHAGALNDLALCYARAGKLHESAETLGKAVEMMPDLALYRNNLATVLTQLDRYDEALVHLQSVQGVGLGHYNLACLLHKKGDPSGAAKHFMAAAAADPNLSQAKRWAEQLAAQPPTATYYSTPQQPVSGVSTEAASAHMSPVSYGNSPAYRYEPAPPATR